VTVKKTTTAETVIVLDYKQECKRENRHVCNNYNREANLVGESLLQRRADIHLCYIYRIANGHVALDFSNELVPHSPISTTTDPLAFFIPTETKQ
jgi:hypothetical protein